MRRWRRPECIHACAFQPSAKAGNTVTAQQLYVNPNGANDPGGTVIPAPFQPGQAISIEVGMGPSTAQPGQAFTVPGYYTFTFGIGVDGSAPVFAATSPSTLLAPIAHQWTGTACTAAAMQAQIPPATTSPTYYLCPGS
jgi:hypothetical protein